MKLAYFDCPFGAAGDMLLGALIGAGLPYDKWTAELRKISLPEGSFEVSVCDVVRGTISAKKLDVHLGKEHHREHDHERHLGEITRIVNDSDIAGPAKELAIKIFNRLAEAESRVHGVTPDEIHFHEVGAVDAVVDIVGFAIGYHMLGIERSQASALPLGSGVTKTEHGLFPVPGPATAYLLSEAGAPVLASDIDYECLTPTGAAILTTVCSAWGRAPAMSSITGIGYGAGTKESPHRPNVSRVMLGEGGDTQPLKGESNRFQKESVCVLEANLDDISPQTLSFVLDLLLKAGALDVAVVPAVMKKGRSGQILSVVCKPEDDARLRELILIETTSLGVRSHLCQRSIAERQWKKITLSFGSTVRVKVALDKSGHVINRQPEYDDCAAYATANGVPLKDVLNEAIAKSHMLE